MLCPIYANNPWNATLVLRLRLSRRLAWRSTLPGSRIPRRRAAGLSKSALSERTLPTVTENASARSWWNANDTGIRSAVHRFFRRIPDKFK